MASFLRHCIHVHVECVYVQARIIALEREIEMLKKENCKLQTDAKRQFLLNSQEWQQKLNDSEERSSASMRELQDKCKNLENSNENLKREMEEAFEEAWEEAGLAKKESARHGFFSSLFGSLAFLPQSSGASKKSERSVKDSVKSAIKDKTQELKGELARVKAQLTASQEKVDELKEVMQQLCDARDNNVVTAVGLQQTSACTDPHVCNIEQESELMEIRVKLSAQEKLFEECARKLQEALQLVASRNTATI